MKILDFWLIEWRIPKLEYDYLSSAEKLLEFQKLYFEDSLKKKSLDEINKINIFEDDLTIDKLKISTKWKKILRDLF